MSLSLAHPTRSALSIDRSAPSTPSGAEGLRVLAISTEVLFDGADPGAYLASAAYHQIRRHTAPLAHYHMINRTRGRSAFRSSALSSNVFLTLVEGRTTASFLANLPRAVRALHREHHFDLVTTENPFGAGVAGWVAARSARLPLGIEVHGEVLHHPSWFSTRRFSRLVHAVGLGVVRAADAVRVVSRPQYERLRARGFPPEKLVHVPCAVDLDLLDESRPVSSPGERRRVLFAARLVREKNPAAVVGIARELAKRGSRLRISVYGDGPYRETLEAAAREGLPIDCHGQVPYSTVVEAMHGCLCVLLTSFTEGTARVILEGFAARRPCVVSDIAANRAVLGEVEAGWLVPLDRHDLFAERLVALERDPAGADAMGERGRDYVRAHASVEVIQPRYVDYYRTVVARHRAHARR